MQRHVPVPEAHRLDMAWQWPLPAYINNSDKLLSGCAQLVAGLIQFAQGRPAELHIGCACAMPAQELYSHYTQQVKDTCASLSDPHKAYLLRKAMHYFNTQRQHRQEAHDKPLIEV